MEQTAGHADRPLSFLPLTAVGATGVSGIVGGVVVNSKADAVGAVGNIGAIGVCELALETNLRVDRCRCRGGL